MGDAAGISSELAARVLADPEIRAAEIIVIGDARMLARGAQIAGIELDIDTLPVTGETPRITRALPRPLLLDLGHCDPDSIALGVVAEAGGRFATENFNRALAMAADGQVDAVCFTPFNKSAMRLVTPGYDDEISFTARAIRFDGIAKEFNVLDGLWNARVTSHVPLRDVASLLTEKAILENLRLTNEALKASGLARPRIAVAAGKAEQIACEGPFPADTVFMRARRGDFDAVLTMYHDQGQIAMKLIGFDAGVTMLGGFPFPICTAAHGTAYEIAGKGVAHPGAMRNAILLAARMAAGVKAVA